jgi:DNA-binding NarL/FixJ family response regulator
MTYAIHFTLLCGDPRRALAWRRQIEAGGKHKVKAIGHSAAEAPALIRRSDPDVLVCNLHLADGPATELVRRLRQGATNMGVMILMVTPSADDPILVECLRHGADSYYIDNGPGPTLASRVEQMLQGESKMSPTIAQQVLEHFQRQDADGQRAGPVDEMLNPLLLSDLERSVLLRVAQGQSVPEIASAEKKTMHQVAKCIRGLYRKMAWDLRAIGLSLELL